MNEAQGRHPRWEELAAFDLGRLSDSDWPTVADHLAGCDQCCSLLDTAPQDAFVTLLRSPTNRQPVAGAETCPAAEGVASEVPAALATHPRYQVLDSLGSGGMGVVFKAEHVLMGRLVALKVLHGYLADLPGAAERFSQEIKALARLSHANVVSAFDAEQAGDILFLVMEYVEGESLDRLLRRCGRLPVDLALDWVRQAATALQFAWEHGLVHRDIKPANLLVTPQGQVKVLDFGLARFLGPGPSPGQVTTGVMVGTPQYIAPEQARDPKSADIRADLYSLGCSWYEMLTGRPPFAGGTVLQQLLAHQEQTPQPVRHLRPEVPTDMAAALHRLLAKQPEERFQTPRELLDFLDRGAGVPPPGRTARPPLAWALAAVVSAAVLLFGLLAWAGLGWLTAARPVDPPEDRAAAERPKQSPAPVEPKVAATKPQQEPPPRFSARDQAVAWVQANNRFGPAHVIVQDTRRKFDARLSAGKAFLLQLNGKLVKTGRPTLLAGRQDDFFPFELPPGTPDLPPNVTMLAVTAAQNQEFQPDEPVLLSNLRIERPADLDGDKKVKGTVAYRTVRPVSGILACRLTFLLGKSTRTHYYQLNVNHLAGRGELRFSFTALFTNENRTTGPVVLFFDVSALDHWGMNPKSLVLSNTLAELVTVHDAKLQKAEPAGQE